MGSLTSLVSGGRLASFYYQPQVVVAWCVPNFSNLGWSSRTPKAFEELCLLCGPDTCSSPGSIRAACRGPCFLLTALFMGRFTKLSQSPLSPGVIGKRRVFAQFWCIKAFTAPLVKVNQETRNEIRCRAIIFRQIHSRTSYCPGGCHAFSFLPPWAFRLSSNLPFPSRSSQLKIPRML